MGFRELNIVLCRPSGALVVVGHVTQPFRAGLNNIAPLALAVRTLFTAKKATGAQVAMHVSPSTETVAGLAQAF